MSHRSIALLFVSLFLAAGLSACGKKGTCVLGEACMENYAESDCAKMSSAKFDEKPCASHGFTIQSGETWTKKK